MVKIALRTVKGQITDRDKPPLAALTVYKNAVLKKITPQALGVKLGASKSAIRHKNDNTHLKKKRGCAIIF